MHATAMANPILSVKNEPGLPEGIHLGCFLYIKGQIRADVFKSLHESAKTASGEHFSDFLQTIFHEKQTFCRLFAEYSCGPNIFMHNFCRLFEHLLQQMIRVLQTSCTLILYLQTFCRMYAHILQRT
jgi:hypothetical protein